MWFVLFQGRSKSLTHIDTLDPGMLVSRENSGDCRSEPDSTMQLAGGSQDRLSVPAMATPIVISSPVTASATVVSVPGTAPIGPLSPVTGETSPTDPAVRRRRLSNLYKVIHRRCLFLILSSFSSLLYLFCASSSSFFANLSFWSSPTYFLL